MLSSQFSQSIPIQIFRCRPSRHPVRGSGLGHQDLPHRKGFVCGPGPGTIAEGKFALKLEEFPFVLVHGDYVTIVEFPKWILVRSAFAWWAPMK
jgi:hypothetical protein